MRIRKARACRKSASPEQCFERPYVLKYYLRVKADPRLLRICNISQHYFLNSAAETRCSPSKCSTDCCPSNVSTSASGSIFCMVSQTLDVEALHRWMSRHYMGRMHLETVSIRKIASQQQVRTCMMAVQAAEVPVVAQHVLLFSSKLYGPSSPRT